MKKKDFLRLGRNLFRDIDQAGPVSNSPVVDLMNTTCQRMHQVNLVFLWRVQNEHIGSVHKYCGIQACAVHTGNKGAAADKFYLFLQ